MYFVVSISKLLAECAPRTDTITGQFSVGWSRLVMRAASHRWFLGAGLLHTALACAVFGCSGCCLCVFLPTPVSLGPRVQCPGHRMARRPRHGAVALVLLWPLVTLLVAPLDTSADVALPNLGCFPPWRTRTRSTAEELISKRVPRLAEWRSCIPSLQSSVPLSGATS